MECHFSLLICNKRGANWLHGESADNPILDIAKQTGTRLHNWNATPAVFDEDGRALSGRDVTDIETVFWETVAEAFEYSKQHTEVIPPDRSLMDFVREKAKEVFINDPFPEQHRKRKLLLQEAEMWGAFVGGTIQRQSLKFFWLEECIEGENPFVADTYKKILDAIKEPALDGSKLLLNTEVVSIATQIDDERGVEGADVRTHNGDNYSFDEVVVTLPLGCLKQQKALFDPPLPQRLSEAVDAIGYGCLDKVCIKRHHVTCVR